MNLRLAGRMIAVVVGAAVVFGLYQGLGVEIYIAIFAGALAYATVRAVFAYMIATKPGGPAAK
jgi:hypothetical protein